MSHDHVTVVTADANGQPIPADLPVDKTVDDSEKTPEVVESNKENNTQPKPDDKPWKEKTEAERIQHGMQKRIDKLTAKNHDYEAVVQSLQDEMRELRQLRTASPAPAPTPSPASADGRPQPLPNEDPVDYIDRLTEWKIEQKAKAQAAEQQKAAQQKTDQEVLDAWNQRVVQAQAKYEDWQEVADNAAPIAPFAARAIMESNVGTDIAYYLANNPEETKRISSLTPTAQAREIGRLEARFTEQGGGRKVSSAPEPIDPIGDKGTTGAVSKQPSLDDPNLPYDEWKKLRNQQLRSRRGR